MTEQQAEAPKVIAGSIQIGAQLASSGKQITVSTYIYPGEGQEELNVRLDNLMAVIDRQRTKAEIPELEARLEAERLGLQQMRDVLKEMTVKQDSGVKLTPQDRLQITNLKTSIDRKKSEIADGVAKIAEAKQKVA